MSPAREIQILLGRELRRNFRSAKGIVLSVLTLLGGTLAAYLNSKANEAMKGSHTLTRQDGSSFDMVMTSDMIREARELSHLKVYKYDEAMAKALDAAPAMLEASFRVCVFLTPLLIAIVGFDAVSSDLQHRSVRYWSVRARRSSYIGGKFLGLWISVSIVTLALNVLVWVLCAIRGDAEFGSVMMWGLRFWFSTLAISATWCALATLVGSLVKHPFLSLLLVSVSFFAWWLVGVIGFIGRWPAVLYATPNNYDLFLLSPQSNVVLGGVAGLVAITAAFVATTSVLFAKRDL